MDLRWGTANADIKANRRWEPRVIKGSFFYSLHIQVNFTYVGGHVPTFLPGGTSDWQKIADISACKTRMDRKNGTSFCKAASLHLCSVNCSNKRKTTVFCWNCNASVGTPLLPPPSCKGLWNRFSIFSQLKVECDIETVQTLRYEIICQTLAVHAWLSDFLIPASPVLSASCFLWPVISEKYKVFWSKICVEKYFNCDIESLRFCRNMCDFLRVCVC